MSATLPFTIVQGSSKAIDLYLRDENDNPIDLTDLTAFVANVHATTGAPVSISLSASEVVVVGSPLLGHVQLQFPAAKTALMALTNFDATNNPLYTNIEIQVTITGNPDYNPKIQELSGPSGAQYPGVLNIVSALT